MKDPYTIILQPVVTEKSVQAVALKKYTFKVADDATKVDVARAVEQLFPGTVVGKVNTVHVRGRTRRMWSKRRRTEGTTARWKKAIVTLREGKIPLFEGM